MDELLLENSLFTNQDEYNEIIKDKEKVADIFFINYFGFFSLYKLGLRGDMKRYKAEEASLYPKYIGSDNKDVSLSVKMLFDARITKGSVTARMTKLLAKIKGNMLDPKDVDNNALKEILNDSKVSIAYKPSMKVRSIMNKWLDDEFAIEWLAYYLYKIARLPEYKDITKEFVSSYKTGQYAQAYTNILNGSRKKHTGDIPKELQDNDPTNIANTKTDDAVDTLSDKERFMAMFKQAIEAEKEKIVTGVNDVPLKNNSDYTQDKSLPNPEIVKQAEPVIQSLEKVNISLDELIKNTIIIDNSGFSEFVIPTDKEYVYDSTLNNFTTYSLIRVATDLLNDGLTKSNSSVYDSTFEEKLYSFELAIHALLKEYSVKEEFASPKELINTPRALVIYTMIADRIESQTGDYLIPTEFPSFKEYAQSGYIGSHIDKKYRRHELLYGKYLINMFDRILNQDSNLAIDYNSIRGTIQILQNMAEFNVDLGVNYSSDITVTQSLNDLLNTGALELGRAELLVLLFIQTITALIAKNSYLEQPVVSELFEMFKANSMLSTIEIDSVNHHILDEKYLQFFKGNIPQDWIVKGNIPLTGKDSWHFIKDTLPTIDYNGNLIIDAFEDELVNRTTTTKNIFLDAVRSLCSNNFITIATPTGIESNYFTYKNISEFLNYVVTKTTPDTMVAFSNIMISTARSSYIYNNSAHNQHEENLYYIFSMAVALAYFYRVGVDRLTKGVRLVDLNEEDIECVSTFLLLASNMYIKNKSIPQDEEYKKVIDILFNFINDAFVNDGAFELLSDLTYQKNHKVAVLILTKLPIFSDKFEGTINSLLNTPSNKDKLFSIKSQLLVRTTQSRGAILKDYTLPDSTYNIIVDDIISGNTRIIDTHEMLVNKMLEDGHLTEELINGYLKDVSTMMKMNYKEFKENYFSSQLDLLYRIIQTETPCDNELLKSAINNVYMDMPRIRDLINYEHDDRIPCNIPFYRLMGSWEYNTSISENNDKIIEMMFDNLRGIKGVSGADSCDIFTTAVLRIKDPELYLKVVDRFDNMFRERKYTSFEYRDENHFNKTFDVEIFKKMNIHAQKDMVEIMITEINQRRKSDWMTVDGVTAYVDRLMELLLAYEEVHGENTIKNIVTPARLKTILLNSSIHQIDFDTMQFDLNNGIINTPKKLSKKMLLNLAKLNGFYNKTELKADMKFPRGTKAIDIVKHIRGDIKLIDNVELKLKDVPYDEIEHTEESLKRVNAKMWKTRTNKHKDYMLIFEKEFKPQVKTNNVDTFLAENPNSRVLELAFHGTGRIAGAYISRYGFADVRGDVGIGIAGKMLGNGTYVAVNYDKSASYVTDHGTTYKAGRHNGYLFKLRVAIGYHGVHHQYARAGNGLLVEEWCIKFPTQQIDVLSIFKCRSVTKKEAYDILKDYQ